MNKFVAIQKKRKSVTALFLLLAFWLFGNDAQVFAHGDEDHGDQKPKTTTNEKGAVTRTARLGEYELTFKHPFFEPDAATSAKMFVTKFQTNEPVEKASVAIEIEPASGSIMEAAIEKTETAGSYNVKIPPLSQGAYTIRAKLTYNGETDTATFSDVEVTPAPSTSAENNLSWARTALIAFVFTLVLALFAGLIYFVWHFADDGESLKKETVSA